MSDTERVPGSEGGTGPFPSQYHLPHVYARSIQSGAGNCVCGRWLGHSKHVEAAPGVPVPVRYRTFVNAAAGPPDLEAIKDTWLRVCGPCDAAVATTCTHPDEDYRPVIAALVAEVERLRSAQRVEGQ